MKNVIIIGAGGHGRTIAEIVEAAGDRFLGFLDDASGGERVLGPVSDYAKYDAEFVAAIGNAAVRERIAGELDCRWYTAVHPGAVISPSAEIGEGSVVMANAVVGTGARVGRHCIVNTGAVVEHDNVLEDFVHISVGAKLGGTVSVGKSTWVGIGATVINNVEICGGCMIGAGAVVVKNIDLPGTYLGVPARKQ